MSGRIAAARIAGHAEPPRGVAPRRRPDLRPRAALMLELGLSPLEVADAMAATLDRRLELVAARIGRRPRTISGWANPVDIYVGDEEHDQSAAVLTHPLLDLILTIAASLEAGTPREQALSALDLAERVFGRLGVEEPPPPAEVEADTVAGLVTATAEALQHAGGYVGRIGALLADGRITREELTPAQLAHLRGQARAAAAQLLEVQRVIEAVELDDLSGGRGR